MSKEENKNTNNNRRHEGHARMEVLGRVTQDPEVKEYTKDGKTGKVCSNVSVAVNDFGFPKTLFVRLVLWNEDAERYAKLLHKGDLVSVSGKVRCSEYTKDSITRQQLEIYKNVDIDVVWSAKRAKNTNAKPEDGENPAQEDYPEIGDVGGDGLDDFVDPVDLGDEDLPF